MQKIKKSKRLLSSRSRTALFLNKLWKKALEKHSTKGIGVFFSKRENFRTEMARLKRFGLIDFRKTEDCGYSINLTGDGICEALILEIESAGPIGDKRRVCMVVFDIPEKNRGERAFIRKLLNRCGFLPLQKSVWISLFDVSKQVNRLFKVINFDEWTWVFISERIDE
jgi:DNA-binding transcriptional regulator PaaX